MDAANEPADIILPQSLYLLATILEGAEDRAMLEIANSESDALSPRLRRMNELIDDLLEADQLHRQELVVATIE